MKDNITKITILTIILLTILGVIGFSYAYFNTDVNGEGKYITLNTAELKLRYTDDVTMSLTNAIPGDKIERTFTVENIGTKTVSYNIVWKNLINTINNYDLHLDMKCKSYKNYGKSNQEEYGTCDSFYKAVPTTETSISKDIRRDIEIEVGVTQVYDVTITFLNRTYDQSENLNKSFSGKIDLEEYIDPSPEPIYCTYDGELVQGAEYVNGQYTYRYMQTAGYNTSNELIWNSLIKEGWGVILTDKDSTEPVTSKLCTYINNKPVISASHMFSNSKATSIDLISFNTKNIVDMGTMFYNSQATEIKGLETFNTKNVTTMADMFNNSQATKLDLNTFDTKLVTNMGGMFNQTNVQSLDLSSFDTSKVTYMAGMFKNSEAIKLDLSNFDTSNVVNMDTMFNGSKAIKLNVSNFNTSKVINMQNMFNGSFADELNLSNFNTSNVTNMYGMFWNSKARTINIKSFNTSNVTNMSVMFWNTNTDIIDVSNFDTSNVIQMEGMFRGSKASKIIGLESFDTNKVTNMFNMFSGSSVVELDLSSFDTSSVIRADNIFNSCRQLKTIYASEKFKINDDVEGNSMFWACDNLVGGKGTKYNSSYIDKTYARIDGGTSSPGYFTAR